MDDRQCLLFVEIDAAKISFDCLHRVLDPHRLKLLVKADIIAWDNQSRQHVIVSGPWRLLLPRLLVRLSSPL